MNTSLKGLNTLIDVTGTRCITREKMISRRMALAMMLHNAQRNKGI